MTLKSHELTRLVLGGMLGRVAALLGLVLIIGLSLQPVYAVTPSGEPPKDFNHNATGFPLRGAHERLQCETCHMRGFFKGTPTRCSGCHERFTEMEASKKSPNHIPTTQECDLCHDAFLPNVSWQLVRMDHIGIVNNCALCHNGVMAPGMSANHIATTQPCELCHNSTVSFAGARMDHTGITGGCARCHNGIQATGKSQNHIITNEPCEVCHFSTVSFAGATMNHAGISNNCARCHNGFYAQGVAPNHIPSGAIPCETCHNPNSFASWAGAQNHKDDALTGFGIGSGTCTRCHERGSTYLGINTTRDTPGTHTRGAKATGQCDSCHTSTSDWASTN